MTKRRSQSQHDGIETKKHQLLSFYRKSPNRTMMELKRQKGSGFPFVVFSTNRTIMELSQPAADSGTENWQELYNRRVGK